MTNLPKPPSFRVDGKRALVTGASRGIGLGGAVALAEAGAEVVMAARNEEEIGHAAEMLRAQGWKAKGISLDVGDHDQMVSTVRQYGPFDVLFNNAGTNDPTPYIEVTEENFDKITDLNLKAAFFVAQEVAKGMIKAGKGGSIIHTSSQMGHVGGIDRSVYCGSKFGIEGVTKASSIELAQHQIRVNTICPTFIRTPMTQSTFDNPERVAWLEEKIKLGRVGEIEDIMGAVVFLASEASSLVTGTSLLIDGGWTAD
ncbi:SDR family NAD(P)-dependent oxidoreductase [Pseudahrensia aquimaris]|uniref:SDR family NAD(P)-dependent oxidoreductase n=1 Tax=Pseudahrensia aquimaris TaxID=744461 RepID=A0ABW3FBP5_9HYPH